MMPLDSVSETGLRYYGNRVAHSENRCLDLLRQQLADSEARVKELEALIHRFGYEPIGHAGATDLQILAYITAESRAALNKGGSDD
jgi:hypothetical protein